MPKIIYYSRAFTWYLQNPRGTCHVSRNVSQSLSTLRSKKSKRWTYLNKQPMWSSSGMSQDYKKVWHFYAEFFQIDWSRWGSVRGNCQTNLKVWRQPALNRRKPLPPWPRLDLSYLRPSIGQPEGQREEKEIYERHFIQSWTGSLVSITDIFADLGKTK